MYSKHKRIRLNKIRINMRFHYNTSIIIIMIIKVGTQRCIHIVKVDLKKIKFNLFVHSWRIIIIMTALVLMYENTKIVGAIQKHYNLLVMRFFFSYFFLLYVLFYTDSNVTSITFLYKLLELTK